MEKEGIPFKNLKYGLGVRINSLFYLFFQSSHPTVVFLSCRPSVVNITFLTGLVGVVSSVSWLGQLAV